VIVKPRITQSRMISTIWILLILIVVIVAFFGAYRYTFGKRKQGLTNIRKVYPLCCEECKAHAQKVLDIYEGGRAQRLQFPRVLRHYVSPGSTPEENNLIIELEPLGSGELVNSDTLEFLRSSGLDPSKLLVNDLAREPDGRIVVSNLDSLFSCTKKNGIKV
jgi:hypothetical protein